MSHDHNHHHAPPSSARVLALAVVLTLGFALIEALAGWWSGSLALLGDAGHMLTDGFSLLLAAGSAWLARRAVSRRHSYGFGRAELLSALINSLLMLAIVVTISVSAVNRLLNPTPVVGEAVTLVAFIGLVINLLVAWLLTRGEDNINVRAALLHVIGDLLGSVAALIAGIVIQTTGWMPIDPILSLLIVLLILVSSLRLLREGLHLLLDGVPFDIDLKELGQTLAAIDGVSSVHDLHVWSLSAERQALTAHLVIKQLDDWPRILLEADALLRDHYHIEHATLQPEVHPAPSLIQISEPTPA